MFLKSSPGHNSRSSFITPQRFALTLPSMPVKRWNFCKANWDHYIALTNKFAKTLLLPDSLDVDAAYQDFCNIIKKAADHAGIETTIFRVGMQNANPSIERSCSLLRRRLKFGCYSSACQA